MKNIQAIAIAALGLLAAHLSEANANGRPPASISLSKSDAKPDLLSFGVTFGLLISRNAGATWEFACEDAIGFQGIFDPDYEVAPNGNLYAGTLAALRMTTDGCEWKDVLLGPITTVAFRPDGSALAAMSDNSDSRIYQSADGITFSPLSTPCSSTLEPSVCGLNDWWESLEIAPSDPQRVYLTGFRFVANQKQLYGFRSDDGGATWTELSLTGLVYTNQSSYNVMAIDPTDKNKIYVRVSQTILNEVSDMVFVSTDGGDSFSLYYDFRPHDDVDGQLANAVLVRKNGDVIVGTNVGPYIQKSGQAVPTAAAATYAILCLKESEDGTKVYACSENFGPEKSALSVSTDGVSFTKMVTFAEIAKPISCEKGTPQHDICEDLRWCVLAAQFGIPGVTCPEEPPPVTPVTPPSDKGCCQTSDSTSLWWSALLALAVIGALRRRTN